MRAALEFGLTLRTADQRKMFASSGAISMPSDAPLLSWNSLSSRNSLVRDVMTCD